MSEQNSCSPGHGVFLTTFGEARDVILRSIRVREAGDSDGGDYLKYQIFKELLLQSHSKRTLRLRGLFLSEQHTGVGRNQFTQEYRLGAKVFRQK